MFRKIDKVRLFVWCFFISEKVKKMGEKDDGLGLNLSLGCASASPTTQPSCKLNLMAMPSHHNMQIPHQKTSWNELFYSSSMFLFLLLSFIYVCVCTHARLHTHTHTHSILQVYPGK